MSKFELLSLDMRMAKDHDEEPDNILYPDVALPAYDHTKLSAVNTCPTWGILRYKMHKSMPNSARSMALEAGSASHEGFAAVRLYQYYAYQATTAIQKKNVDYHGILLFGEDRYARMLSTLSDQATHRTNAINFTIEAVESSTFYDDISDNRRTLSNISESLIAYIDAYDMERYPIWIRDKEDPKTDVGIEIPYNIVVGIKYKMNDQTSICTARFTGKLDGLHYNKDELIVIEEKTGARLDDSWLSQWMLSHQITGYCLAATTFTGLPCNHALVSGMRIPIGRVPAEGIRKEYVPRSPLMFEKWANWFVTTIDTIEQYKDNVIDAPMYTHSCNRYFRSCSFLPFCACDTVEDKQQIIDEMVDDEWDVLNE
tara:strand:- start:10202 stop:11311 length:1110 start_codon:yes stop_codon:yes gene_type:complete